MSDIVITKNLGYDVGIADGVVDLVVNDAGTVIYTKPLRYIPVSSWSISEISPIIVSDSVVLVLEADHIEMVSPYSYAHLEFYLTYNSDFVFDGAQSSDVLYKFESIYQDG